LDKKVNIIDVGASDGIASKFFNRKLKINKIICFEPNKSYVRILKKLNIKNLIINPYGISQFDKYYEIFFPRYKFFSKNLDLITYTHYSKKALLDQINLDFKFKKNISIVKEKIYLKKVKKIMKCPECDADLNIPEDAAVGEIVSCSDCGADYEISKKDGSTIEIKEAETVGEDWGE